MMAQDGRISWPEMIQDGQGNPFIAVNSHHLTFKPIFLQRGNSLTMLRALELGHRALNIEELVKLSKAVPVWVHINSDLAAACGRLKQEIAERFRLHNIAAKAEQHGILILVDGQCIAHILHREVKDDFEERS